ncbi:related to regulatory protein SET1 [Melanopsichium pennsylvanicum]|uniref:Histone-lysine N-methyltransferase, H3 lysine-4 specific n=2 Tax=Melanopsichium pennsylvanicum TaxID=63383 RepID=A0AAJ4XKT8_9BASI|nr:related to regulatory protein SET1 [Melanopsichium pennsylvanicum 4]SNX84395.1 related to regulatory protein SET1 [Melanopsichium pennsylvanicum]
MPSYASEKSYAEASSSRHVDNRSPLSRSSRSDRRSDDTYRRPRSPDPRHKDSTIDRDEYRPSVYRHDDDRRYSHRTSHSSRLPDYEDRDYRSRRLGWSSPPHDHHRSQYNSTDSVAYDRHSPTRRRSPEPWRYRSLDPSHARDIDSREGNRRASDRTARRKAEDDRDRRQFSISDGAHSSRNWRDDRSPDRSRHSYKDRELERSGQNGDARQRDDHGRSRRSGRSRSRSRSRERSRATGPKAAHRSAAEGEHLHTMKREDRPEHVNGSREELKLRKRTDTTEAISIPAADKEEEEGAILEEADDWDVEEDKLERLASASKARRERDDKRATTSYNDRQLHAGRSAAEVRLPSKSNGHATEPSRTGYPYHDSRERRRSRSPPRKPSTTSSSSSALQVADPTTPSPIPNAATRPTLKGASVKRSFEHVPLPHELPAELRGKNYQATELYKKGVRILYKSAAEKQLVDEKPNDPRKGVHRTHRFRDALRQAKFTWDTDSVGKKPLPSPRNLVLTNLSGLTQPNQIMLHVRPCGRVESSKLEINPTIGQSLGIFYVTFAHDFDEQGKVVERAPADQPPQNGAKVAKAAHLALNGCIIGQTRVVAFLDRSGEVLAEKVKEKLAADQAKLRRPPPSTAPASLVNASSATPSTSKPNMPPPNVPRGPRASVNAASSPSVSSASPLSRPSTDCYDNSPSRHPRYAANSEDARKSGSADAYSRRRGSEEYDTHRSRSYNSRQPERSARSDSSSQSEAREPRKLPTQEIIDTLRNGARTYIFIPRPANCDIKTSAVEKQLESTPPLWIREGDAGWYAAFTESREANACKVVNETLTINGFTLQLDVRPPPSKKPVLGAEERKIYPSAAATSSASGARPLSASTQAAQLRKTLDTGLRPLQTEEKKTDWIAAELQDAVFRILQMELADTFIRDVKNRLVAPHLSQYLQPDGEGGQILAKPSIRKPKSLLASKNIDHIPKTSKAEFEARLPSFRKVASAKPRKVTLEADKEALKTKKAAKKDRGSTQKVKSHRGENASSSDDESGDTDGDAKLSTRRDSSTRSKPATKRRGAAALPWDSLDKETDSDDAAITEADITSRSVSASVEPSIADEMEGDVIVKGGKKPKAKAEVAAKKKLAAKKGAKASGTLKELDGELDAGDETATPETGAVSKTAKAKAKPAKPSAKMKPIPADPFEAGLVEDAEDCYYLRLALSHLQKTSELPNEDTLPDQVELEAEAEELSLASGSIPKHSTGSARTEGYYRILPGQKAIHLPDRNKATEEADTTSNAHILQSARNNRADSRRLVLGIEQHKRETATDTDIFKFNQLRTRKKQLKFAKSPIHDWGLYAMEFIPAGDMVIEYVGEVVRQQVADEREKQYERQGNFSTYLFRVDDDLVVDATHKGNIARLMNHCCTPNCNAKILTLNGDKRIVLFAKTPIRAGEELTYDYKFQSSADDEDAIPCLCGSAGCRRFL